MRQIFKYSIILKILIGFNLQTKISINTDSLINNIMLQLIQIIN